MCYCFAPNDIFFMKTLFIGDICAKPGRRAVTSLLAALKKEHGIDFVIANAENIRHGSGVGEEQLNEMRKAGVDFFTSGNHVFKHREIIPFMDNERLKLIRPANYPPGVPGKGYMVVKTALMKDVLIINLLGRLFISQKTDCPFRTADAILEEFKNVDFAAIIVDFHAEATSEKVALAHYLDGRVSAVLGTHTHVPTADERILPGGTAFQSDVGFAGPLDSVIGVDKKIIMEHFLTQMPVKHEIAAGPVVLNATAVETDEKGRAKDIYRIARTIDAY